MTEGISTETNCCLCPVCTGCTHLSYFFDLSLSLSTVLCVYCVAHCPSMAVCLTQREPETLTVPHSNLSPNNLAQVTPLSVSYLCSFSPVFWRFCAHCSLNQTVSTIGKYVKYSKDIGTFDNKGYTKKSIEEICKATLFLQVCLQRSSVMPFKILCHCTTSALYVNSPHLLVPHCFLNI